MPFAIELALDHDRRYRAGRTAAQRKENPAPAAAGAGRGAGAPPPGAPPRVPPSDSTATVHRLARRAGLEVGQQRGVDAAHLWDRLLAAAPRRGDVLLPSRPFPP